MKGKGIAFCLAGITMLAGILLLVSGIKGTVAQILLSRDYETTEGYLSDYEIYSKGGSDAAGKTRTNDTYRLIYRYVVDGREYTVSTDMGVGLVPEMGSAREVRYHPEQPDEAFLQGPDSHAFKIFFGLFFLVVSSFFIWVLTPEKKKRKKKADGKPKKTSADGFGMAVGLALLFFSYGCLFFITGEYSLFGIARFYRDAFFFPMIVPALMFAAGGFLFVKSIFGGRRKSK